MVIKRFDRVLNYDWEVEKEIMNLFDNIKRETFEPAQYAEPIFPYLNRSARNEADTVRKKIEEWFTKYPPNEQSEFRARFRSDNDAHHQAAVFELFLHELMRKLGCQIKLHPIVKDSTNKPDFLVQSPSGEAFYVEATLATGLSVKEAGAQARINTVYDSLDRSVKSPNFFLWLVEKGAPATQPPTKKLVAFLNKWLASLDPDKISKQREKGGLNAYPTTSFEHDGWQIEVRAIPKTQKTRGKSGVRPIGMKSSDFQVVDHRTAIRDAIIGKASRYGKLDLPYIVSVNALEPIDEIDIMEALFGREQFSYFVSKDRPGELVQGGISRAPDGVWTGPDGPRNSRVSGVLLVKRLSVWSFPRSYCRLYHNPWAEKSYSGILTRLPQAIPKEGKLKQIDGETIGSFFDLSPSWPE